MRVTLAQLNPTVGDIDGNTSAILDAVDQATRERSDLIVTPEMAVLGYPPRDLLLREGVAERCRAAVNRIAARCTTTCALVGFPEPWPEGPRPFRNAVAVCRKGVVERVYAKRLLPTYDVFDEDRYFTPGNEPAVIDVAGERVGILVCEDLWRATDVTGGRRYTCDPVVDSLVRGATALAILSASPYILGKEAKHQARLAALAAKGTAVMAVNQAGANDDLIFDGRSRVIGPGGALGVAPTGWCRAFEADVRTFDVALPVGGASTHGDDDGSDELIEAMVCGIRDYLHKTGHRSALIGLSGGIDSALVAALAAMAIGGANVTGVLMPSRYSSQGSIDDALDTARRLSLKAAPVVPIERAHAALRETLGMTTFSFEGLADENLQSRLRGMILMAISNASGALVLTTGNKSELATGYATLYGDMCGGLAPIGDLLKTRVYAVARRLNERFGRFGFGHPPIPPASIEKVPSAELRPNQTDQDSLPPYDILDAIVEGRIEREEAVESIVARTGIDEATALRWSQAIDRMQYKRDQGAVILKLTPRAFGRGRPMPIAGCSDAARQQTAST
ncbi:MAG: NAD+ synthase [Phycisphaerae bacterium]|nr:NAD+ synthase [Phycisphaerae bacterium]